MVTNVVEHMRRLSDWEVIPSITWSSETLDVFVLFFFFQAEDGIRDLTVTGVQTCALPIFRRPRGRAQQGPDHARASRGAGGRHYAPRRGLLHRARRQRQGERLPLAQRYPDRRAGDPPLGQRRDSNRRREDGVLRELRATGAAQPGPSRLQPASGGQTTHCTRWFTARSEERRVGEE